MGIASLRMSGASLGMSQTRVKVVPSHRKPQAAHFPTALARMGGGLHYERRALATLARVTR